MRRTPPIVGFLILLSSLFASPLAAAIATPSTDCATLGFAETLVCSKCKLLEKHLNGKGKEESENESDANGLIKECERCCVDDVKAQKVLYTSGTLEVCS
eukprot:TRINITY_DN1208_c2_g1_i1.p1 TRINITY_DN1208_c2_g1~~TRINITY_DN1208_c2_g1_i1.p1  ORF type:complete len:100 (+),score=20.74 TRINITY_DN1208_c2_g1_i1:63-362(+)